MRNLWRLMMLLAVSGIPPMPSKMPVSAAEPAEDAANLDQEVRRLLGDLAGETRAQRVAAEKRLVELGPRVLPLLPAPDLLPSVSVREAVRRIRVELERAAAKESVRPSRVTLERTMPVGRSIAEIARQTANRLDGHLLPESHLQKPIDADYKSTPFWQALDDLAARLKLRYEYDPRIRGLTFVPAEPERELPKPAVSYAGAFRIEALSAERIPRVAGRRKGQNPRALGELLRVTVVLMPEPRLRPLFLQFAASEIGARAEDKLKLTPFSPEADYELPLSESGAPARIQLDYILPKGAAGTSLEISGKLHCTTAAGQELIRFADLEKAEGGAANVARRRGGVTVTLNKVRIFPSPGGRQEARIQVTVTYDAGGPAFESHRAWILHNEVFLEDRAGQRVELNGGSETTLQEDGAVGIEYRFVDLPASLRDYAFVYVAPTLIVDVPIEFEIQSVPIGKKSPDPKSNDEIPKRSPR